MAKRSISPGRRYRQIVSILTRHGFGFLVQDLGLSELLSFYRRLRIGRLDEEDLGHLPIRIRQLLEDLGPTFVKIGQFLSTRSDVIPPEVIQELSLLRESANPIPVSEVRRVLQESWGKSVEEVCLEFDDQPLGSASIGQVHRAVLLSGEEVAIKVRRPGITGTVQADLVILADLAALGEQHWDWAKRLGLIQVVAEFSVALKEELDYRREARNAERIARQNLPDVKIPKIYHEFSSDQVLVLEYLSGYALEDREGLIKVGVNLEDLAEHLIRTVLAQMLEFGYYHGDLHPGNLRVIPENTLIFLDFGLLGRLDQATRRHLSSLVICLMLDDNRGISDVLLDMGAVDGQVDEKALRADVERLRQEYYGIPLEELQIGEALESLWNVAARHQVRVPPDMALLAKTVMTLEGVVRNLAPGFNILAVAEPYAWKLLRNRFHPINLLQEGWSSGRQFVRSWTQLPNEVHQALAELREGRMTVKIDPQWEKRVERLESGQRGLQRSLILLCITVLLAAMILSPNLSWSWLPSELHLVEISYGVITLLFLWLIKLLLFS